MLLQLGRMVELGGIEEDLLKEEEVEELFMAGSDYSYKVWAK